jgi:hypothetical protein
MTQRFVRVIAVRAVVVLALVATTSVARAQTAQPTTQPAQPAPAAPKLTFSGDLALWTVAIKPDKTADFERVMARLREALTTSSNPDRQKQAAGWKVMKLEKPLPDGNVAYVHVISPVVSGVDYSVMEILYDAFPNERQQLYDMYRGAFAQNLSLAAGRVVLDMSRPAQTVASTIVP